MYHLQRKIHLLYKELNLESSITYVPVSILIRNYVKEGMKSKNRKNLTTMSA
jgi:hypothetical protein